MSVNQRAKSEALYRYIFNFLQHEGMLCDTIYPFPDIKENQPKLSQICSYWSFSKELKYEFETAMVNKPLVLEPLKFYCSFESECQMVLKAMTNDIPLTLTANRVHHLYQRRSIWPFVVSFDWRVPHAPLHNAEANSCFGISYRQNKEQKQNSLKANIYVCSCFDMDEINLTHLHYILNSRLMPKSLIGYILFYVHPK